MVNHRRNQSYPSRSLHQLEMDLIIIQPTGKRDHGQKLINYYIPKLPKRHTINATTKYFNPLWRVNNFILYFINAAVYIYILTRLPAFYYKRILIKVFQQLEERVFQRLQLHKLQLTFDKSIIDF